VALLDTSIFAPAATPLALASRHSVAEGKAGSSAGRFAAMAVERQGFSNGRFDFAQLFIILANFVKKHEIGLSQIAFQAIECCKI
jgi:hypothetical protein